jgi:Uma2 family endonuclease
LPRLPTREPIRTVPDWICEVLSPRTRSYDLVIKRRFYAEIGVGHLWYIDSEARTVTISRLEQGRWLELGIHGPDETLQAEPFDAIAIDLARWFEGFDEPEGDAPTEEEGEPAP